MVLTAEQAFKKSQKGAIREKKKNEKRHIKEFHLVMKEIHKATRQGETNAYFHFHMISYLTVSKLDKLGYKIKHCQGGVNVSWEDAGDSVTGREGKVYA